MLLEQIMKITYKNSIKITHIGSILGLLLAFINQPLCLIVLGVTYWQMFKFYRCPHCDYGLYNVHGSPGFCPNCGEDL